MAVSFQIDSVTMPKDPEEVEWESREILDLAHSGAPLRNARRIVRLAFGEMTPTDFNTLMAYDDGAAHTLRIPHPTTVAYTDYAGAYFRLTGASFQDVHVEAVEFEASWIVA
jgi:hypothetical protein